MLDLHAKGLSKEDIAKACEIGIASVYRIIKANKPAQAA
jgi:transposase